MQTIPIGCYGAQENALRGRRVRVERLHKLFAKLTQMIVVGTQIRRFEWSVDGWMLQPANKYMGKYHTDGNKALVLRHLCVRRSLVRVWWLRWWVSVLIDSVSFFLGSNFEQKSLTHLLTFRGFQVHRVWVAWNAMIHWPVYGARARRWTRDVDTVVWLYSIIAFIHLADTTRPNSMLLVSSISKFLFYFELSIVRDIDWVNLCLLLVERFDPRVGRWSPVPSMSSKRSSVGVATLDGELYCVGGNDGSMCMASGERFNARRNSWEPIAAMETRRWVQYSVDFSEHIQLK